MAQYSKCFFISRNCFRFIITIVFILFILNIVNAQPRVAMDSLFTTKAAFKKDEKIDFLVKLNNKSKKKAEKLRQVTAFACACNNKDFCYILYHVKDGKKAEINNELYINHTQNPYKPQCLCKIQYINFVDGNKYDIPAIKESGNYFIEITGNDFLMYSNIFSVLD